MIAEIPFGYCHCGCGQETKLATATRASRNWTRGQPQKFINSHHLRGQRGQKNNGWKGGRITREGYVFVYVPNALGADARGYMQEHRYLAECALGKRIPDSAEVHHFNEIRSDNRNNNLVICNDTVYHGILHDRMRAWRECGNPAYYKCKYCKQWDDPINLHVYGKKGRVQYHIKCRALYIRTYRAAKRLKLSQN